MEEKRLTTQELIEEHKDLLLKFRKVEKLSIKATAIRLSEELECGVSKDVVFSAFKKLGINKLATNKISKVLIEDKTEQPEEITIDELIESRIKASRVKRSKHRMHNRSLELPAEPIGFLVMGDPHIDNEGCDFAKLLEDIELTQKQEGVMAACVGDIQDNWIGRLQKLYANSSMKASDGWRLSKWMLSSLQWVAIVGGNHDSWSHAPGVDPLGWVAKECGVLCYAPDELRITLNWRGRPDLEPIVWVIRHDFRGRSWFHPTHGVHKEAMLDGRCHLLTAGHIHQWGQLTSEQRHERVTHSLRVRGYKRADAYAVEKGFYEQQFGESALVVIDPTVEGTGRINVYWDLKQGYEILSHMRDCFFMNQEE